MSNDKDELQRLWASLIQDSSLVSKFALIGFDVDALRNPEEAIATRAIIARKLHYDRIFDSLFNLYLDHKANFFESIVREVADLTGDDPEQIANSDTRTPAQDAALHEAEKRRHKARLDAFERCAYVQAVRALDEIDGAFDAYDKTHVTEAYSLKETVVLLFFAFHPEIRPSATDATIPADELLALYMRFENFVIDYFGGIERTAQARGHDYNLMRVLYAFIEQDQPSQAEEIIEQLSAIVLPTKHIIANSKLSNCLPQMCTDDANTLVVSKKGAKREIETTVLLTFEGDDRIKLSGRKAFSRFDRSVYDALVSLYIYGDQKHVYTLAQIWRAMTNADDTEKPTPQQIAAVRESVDRMRFTRAVIDCTGELQARRVTLNGKQINGGEIDTYLLNADHVKVQAGGQTVQAYRINQPPILYSYAAAIRQVLTIPANLLDIKKLDKTGKPTTRSMQSTTQNIVIRDQLLRRIEGMKGKNSLTSDCIALYDYQRDGEVHEGLFTAAGVTNPSSDQAKHIRGNVEAMLAYWQAIHYIKAFEKQTAAKGKIIGYRIITI